MSASALPFESPRPVARKVSRLRLLVRLYVLAEGLAAVAIVAGLAFWLGLAIDWLWEPRPALRVAMWMAAAATAMWVAWRFVGRRLFARLRSDSLALLVERQYPHLREGLITTVQADLDDNDDALHRRLINVTAQRTADAMHDVDVRRVFNVRPLAWKTLAALALGSAVAAFAGLAPAAFGFWVERMRLSEVLWPRRVQLTVVGFDRAGEGVVNVARNDDFDLEVLASIENGHEAPAEVEVRWRRPSDGVRGRGPMLRIGEATPGRDQSQRYRYTFKVASDLEFDVIGGDDRVRGLRLRAVERPTPTQVSLDCTYPEYLNRPPRTLRVSGAAELPEGATAVCRVVANKPLASVRVHDPSAQADLTAKVSAKNPAQFTFAIDKMQTDRVFMLTLHDTDGVENREPFRLPISVLPDQAPEVAVQLRGIGSAVTPQARIPLAGKVTDDYALEEGWFEYEVDENEPQRRLLAAQPTGLASLQMTEAFDLAEADPETKRPRVEVKPGQQLTLTVQARDAYDLRRVDESRGDSPTVGHIGSSGRFRLDVVTASELRALLEKRELGLRQRFEAIYEKMVGVRDLLGRIDLAQRSRGADDDASATGSPVDAVTQAMDSAMRRDLGRISGAGQNATQLAFETGGVAEGFDDILAELVNNRVDTEELKQRLQQGIAEPLKEIGDEMLPALKERLATLEAAMTADRAGAAAPLAAAQAEADAVVDAMKRILDHMLELESYNELVELLRGIVQEHERLNERMKEEQRRKLRSLLDEDE